MTNFFIYSLLNRQKFVRENCPVKPRQVCAPWRKQEPLIKKTNPCRGRKALRKKQQPQISNIISVCFEVQEEKSTKGIQPSRQKKLQQVAVNQELLDPVKLIDSEKSQTKESNQITSKFYLTFSSSPLTDGLGFYDRSYSHVAPHPAPW